MKGGLSAHYFKVWNHQQTKITELEAQRLGLGFCQHRHGLSLPRYRASMLIHAPLGRLGCRPLNRPYDIFLEINGYSIEYPGWGSEDDDLFLRISRANKNKIVNLVNKFDEIKTPSNIFKSNHKEAWANYLFLINSWYKQKRGTLIGLKESKPSTLLSKTKYNSFNLYMAAVSYDIISYDQF